MAFEVTPRVLPLHLEKKRTKAAESPHIIRPLADPVPLRERSCRLLQQEQDFVLRGQK